MIKRGGTLPAAAALTTVVAALLLAGCGFLGPESEDVEPVYPMYLDENGNGVNDYVEAGTHETGEVSGKTRGPTAFEFPMGPAPPAHAFIDENGDGICDYAQNGSATWHGPGFIDEDGDGICDYWDQDAPLRGRHRGLRFRDENRNRINDYLEEHAHLGPGHEYADENADGICDSAQDGSPSWHGPGYVDENGNGRYDHWEIGGRGHGGPHGRGGRTDGMM